MRRIHILVEGQTEELFVKDVLAPYLTAKQIYPITKLAMTKFVEGGPNYKGGVNRYLTVKRDLQRLLGDSSASLVTTMIDFYGLPDDFPKPADSIPTKTSCFERVELFEKALAHDINHPKFHPYFALHEFEAMLFADPEKIANQFPDLDKLNELEAIRKDFDLPEEINDNPASAPSKRIKFLFPEYRKPLHGVLISRSIGLEQIRAECPHFSQWLQKLESLAEEK